MDSSTDKDCIVVTNAGSKMAKHSESKITADNTPRKRSPYPGYFMTSSSGTCLIDLTGYYIDDSSVDSHEELF